MPLSSANIWKCQKFTVSLQAICKIIEIMLDDMPDEVKAFMEKVGPMIRNSKPITNKELTELRRKQKK